MKTSTSNPSIKTCRMKNYPAHPPDPVSHPSFLREELGMGSKNDNKPKKLTPSAVTSALEGLGMGSRSASETRNRYLTLKSQEIQISSNAKTQP